MDFLQLRQVLKQQFRNSAAAAAPAAAHPNTVKVKKNDVKNSSASSLLFPRSECGIPERVMEESRALMPEILNLLGGKKPTSGGAAASVVDSKSERVKKMKESRDYSFLTSETAEPTKGSQPNQSNVKSLPHKPLGNSKPNMSATKVAKKVPEKNNSNAAKPQPSIPVSGKPTSTEQSVKVLKVKQEETASNNASKNGDGLKLKKQMKQRQVKVLEEDDDTVDYSSLIREIVGTRGKRKYRNWDDGCGDDRSMVSGFNDIQKEERRSALIARKEDAIELARIEEEERQERLRKTKKQTI